MSMGKKGGLNTAFLLIIIIAILGAGVGVLTKVVVREIPPFSFTFFRFFIASFFVLPYLLKQKHKFNKHFFHILLICLLATGNVTLYPVGVAYTQANIAQTLYSVSPVLAAILSFYLYKERFSMKKKIGIILGFIGALLIMFLPVISNGTITNASMFGNVIIFLAVVSFTIYTVLSKHGQLRFSPNYITSIFIVLTTIVLIPFLFIDSVIHPNWWHAVSIQSIFYTFLISSFGTYGLYLLNQYAVKHSNPVVATSALYIQPAAAFFFSFILLGEQLTFIFLIGVLLVFIGAWLLTRGK